jgi:hypothetical protein
MGINNKMMTGRSPSVQRTLIASPHPLTCPKLAFACWPKGAQTKKEDDLTLNKKDCQNTLAMLYTKMAAILPSKRSWRDKAFY